MEPEKLQERGKAQLNQDELLIKTKKISNEKELIQIVQKNYGMNPSAIRQVVGGNEFKNYIIDYKDEHYILKIQKSTSLQILRANLKLRNYVLMHLEKRDQLPRLDYPRVIQSQKGEYMFSTKVQDKDCYVTMMGFLPGRNMLDEETYSLRNSLMKAVGLLHRDFQKIDIEEEKQYSHHQWPSFIGDARNQLVLRMMKIIDPQKYKEIDEDQEEQTREIDYKQAYEKLRDHKIYLEQFLQAYQNFKVNGLKQMKFSLSHCDLHKGNILTNKEGTEVTGIIDFGWSLSYQYFSADFRYMLTVVTRAIPYQKKIKPSKVIEDIIQMVSHYHRYSPLDLQSLEVECFYFVIGRVILDISKKKSKQLKRALTFKCHLIAQFLRIPKKQFITALREKCKNVAFESKQKQYFFKQKNETQEQNKKESSQLQNSPKIQENSQIVMKNIEEI